MSVILRTLKTVVEELSETNSSNDKIEILRKYDNPELKRLYQLIFDKTVTFGVTSNGCESKQIMKRYELFRTMPQNSDEELFTLLHALADRRLTGHDAIGAVNDFVFRHKEFGELIFRIIDCDLKCRVNAKQINKAFPQLVPEFNVVLAETFDLDKRSCRKNLEDFKYFICRKLDGFRTICKINSSNVQFFSRAGNEVTCLDHLKPELLEWYRNLPFDRPVVLDGETCIMDGDKENFSLAQRELTRKNYTAVNAKYIVFDYISEDTFLGKESSLVWNERLVELENSSFMDNQRFGIIDREIYLKSTMEHWTRQYQLEGWEGLILRKNAPYKSGRSWDLIKVKTFIEEEFVCEGITESEIEILVDGKMRRVKAAGAFIIDFGGEKVPVGPGNVTKNSLIEYYNHPELVVGHEITVKYFEVTENLQNTSSMRFPTCKAVWDGKRNV